MSWVTIIILSIILGTLSAAVISLLLAFKAIALRLEIMAEIVQFLVKNMLSHDTRISEMEKKNELD